MDTGVWFEAWSENKADGGVWAWRLQGRDAGWADNEEEATRLLEAARAELAAEQDRARAELATAG